MKKETQLKGKRLLWKANVNKSPGLRPCGWLTAAVGSIGAESQEKVSKKENKIERLLNVYWMCVNILRGELSDVKLANN